jgi:endonuclease-3 related protein
LTAYEIYKRLLNFFGPQGWWPGDSPFEIMVGAVLTQNTAWRNAERAIQNLKSAGCLNPQMIQRLSETELSSIIQPAGFYRLKARRLKALVEFLMERFNGEVEELKGMESLKLRAELLKVIGIGEETADSILLYALNRPCFVVDGYTRRIGARHGLFPYGARYDEIQHWFMEQLPEDPKLYNEYHALLVRLGKEYCQKLPRCSGCPLG